MSTVPEIPTPETVSAAAEDADLAHQVRAHASTLATAIERAANAGLDVNVQFRLQDRAVGIRTIGPKSEPLVVCHPAVVIRRVTTVVL